MIPTASVLQWHEKECGYFAETNEFVYVMLSVSPVQPSRQVCWRQRYGVKTSEKSNMHNEHWLTSTQA